MAVIYGLNLPDRLVLNPADSVPFTKAADVMYNGFSKLGWSVSVGWVIFACCRGYGGKLTCSNAYQSVNWGGVNHLRFISL